MRDYIYWHLILYVDSRERETFVENSSYTVVDRGSLIQQRLRAVKRKILFEQGFLVIKSSEKLPGPGSSNIIMCKQNR